MKRFAFLAVLLAVVGFNVGCDSGGTAPATTAPEVSDPGEGAETGAEEAPAEGEEG